MRGIVGVFREVDSVVDAIGALRKERPGEMTVYSPTPRHELDHALDHGPSVVRRFTLFAVLVALVEVAHAETIAGAFARSVVRSDLSVDA